MTKVDTMLIPRILQIEVCDKCNLFCSYCDFETYKTGDFMSLDDFSSLVSQADYVEHVCPQFWGESTMHPQFLEMLEFCHHKGKTTSYYTNGTLLHRFDLDALLLFSTKISVSMDVCTREEFKRICKVDCFDVVARNIANLWEAKRRGGHNTEVIIRATRLTRDEAYEAAFRDTWKAHCDRIDFKPLRFTTNPGDEKYVERDQCDMINHHCVIKRDGRMIMCCSDHQGKHTVGNVYERPILELFNSRRYNELRASRHSIAQCQNCWYNYV